MASQFSIYCFIYFFLSSDQIASWGRLYMFQFLVVFMGLPKYFIFHRNEYNDSAGFLSNILPTQASWSWFRRYCLCMNYWTISPRSHLCPPVLPCFCSNFLQLCCNTGNTASIYKTFEIFLYQSHVQSSLQVNSGDLWHTVYFLK